MGKEERIKRRQRDLERIRALRLIDDTFMTLCFDGYIEGAQLLVEIILGRHDLKVTEVKTQKVMKNLDGRDVWLDIYATDIAGNKYDIEIQRSDKGADAKRARYHSSMVDSDMLASGCDFSELRENYVIFITEHDVMGKDLPAYHVERYIKEMSIPFSDGAHIIYVNGSKRRTDTKLGRLMSDFYASDAKDIHYKELADRVKYFKETEKGVSSVCKIMDEVRDEGRAEGLNEGRDEAKKEIAVKLLSLGKMSLEEIAECSGLSLERVRELAGEKTA